MSQTAPSDAAREVSSRASCHDEEANHLALTSLMTASRAARPWSRRAGTSRTSSSGTDGRSRPRTIKRLRFEPNGGRDEDERLLSDEQLGDAAELGRAKDRDRNAS